MSEITKFQTSYHEFLRYAIPGYISLFVLFTLIILTPHSAFLADLSKIDSPIIAALIVIGGPACGYLIFLAYYSLFMWRSYSIEKVEPFKLIREKLRCKKLSLCSGQEEVLVRAIEDLALADSYLKMHSMERERIQFLFSSFHSIGTTILAILLGIVCGSIWVSVNKLAALQEYGVPLIFIVALCAMCVLLLRAWKYRKNLAIMEERLLLAQYDHFLNSKIDEAVKAYRNRAQS